MARMRHGIGAGWVGFVLALAGCPASSDGGAGSGADWECEPGLTGTWEFVYEETSGDCGPLTDEVINFDQDTSGGGTTLVDQDCESESTGDSCEGATTMSACDAQLPDGTPARIERTAFLRQVSADEVEGRYSTRLAIPDGICAGTYKITGTRL
jgi:hypothetical protein